MKTQVSIYVKNASIFSRLWSFLWFINIFKKMSVNAYIDSKDTPPQRLKARSEPYLIDLAPGSHTIVFADPRRSESWRKEAGTLAYRCVCGVSLRFGWRYGQRVDCGFCVGKGFRWKSSARQCCAVLSPGRRGVENSGSAQTQRQC